MPRSPRPPKPNPKPTYWDHHYNYDWCHYPYYDWYYDDDNSYYYYLMRNSMAQKSNKTNPTPMPPTPPAPPAPPKMYDENGNSWELQSAYQQGFKDGFDAAMAYFMYNNMSISCPPAPEPTPTPPMAEGE